MSNQAIKQDEGRLAVLKKIEEFEKKGCFNEDVENDPPTVELKPEDVDYLREKFVSKISTKIANKVAITFIRKLIKDKKLIIKDVVGFENILKINGGFILTCNHFNPFDNFALHEVLYDYLMKNKKHFFKVIREGNYTFPGLYGYFFRNCETLPLSSNFETMKKFTRAVETILKRGDIILIYPEQAMWWNYRKPRPLKPGAFRYAKSANVPIVPCFITMSDSDIIGDDGFLIQEYTINFFEPIYPDMSLSSKDRIDDLCKRNYEVWKTKYEDFYNKPLRYSCEVEEEC